MSRAITLRARFVAWCHRREDQRVTAQLTAIRATAPVPLTRPMAVVMLEAPTRPLRAVRGPVRTDTVSVPRIVLTAGAHL